MNQEFLPLSSADAYPRTTKTDFLDRCSPQIRGFYAYWDSKRNGRQMPARADLDPTEMKAWLANIILVDVQEQPRRLSYRLVGSNQVALRQRDVTGKAIEEAYFGASLAAVLENYRIVIEERSLVYDWSAVPASHDIPRRSETLLLPLSSDGTRVDKVIVYMETEPF